MSLILLVDDEPDMRLALANVLKKEGHTVLEAGDGETGLAQLTQQPVELVLLDVRLPGMDGVETLKAMRESPRRDVPIVMVTGYGSVDTAVKLMEAGASGYLSKPFGNRQLLETVEKALEVRRLGLESEKLHQGLLSKLSPAPAGHPGRGWRPATGRWTAALAAGLLLMAAAFAGVHYAQDRPVRFAAPFANVTALVWQDGRLWAADWLKQTVFLVRPDGRMLETDTATPIADSHLTGLAVVGDYIYTCDSWKRLIQKRHHDRGLSVVSEVASPGPNPSGLFWDGRYLWSCDSSAGRIYQHETDDDLTVVASYPSPDKSPAGLYKDENFLWSADAETRLLYQHRLDDSLTVVGRYRIPSIEERKEPLSAITHRGRHWWIAREGVPRLLRVGDRALEKMKD